jgi:hypothetical protein
LREVHVEVDAPFIFRASEPLPPPLQSSVRLSAAVTPRLPLLALPPPPPPPPAATVAEQQPPAKPKKRRSFFGKVGSFFASLFH